MMGRMFFISYKKGIGESIPFRCAAWLVPIRYPFDSFVHRLHPNGCQSIRPDFPLHVISMRDRGLRLRLRNRPGEDR